MKEVEDGDEVVFPYDIPNQLQRYKHTPFTPHPFLTLPHPSPIPSSPHDTTQRKAGPLRAHPSAPQPHAHGQTQPRHLDRSLAVWRGS